MHVAFPEDPAATASAFHSIILHPFGSLRARIPFLRFFHLSALMSYFCSTINVTSSFTVFHHFSFLSNRRTNLYFRSPFCFYRHCSFHCCCCRLCFFFSFSQTQWHISINIVVFESSSSTSFHVFVFSSCVVIAAVLKKKVSCLLESPRQLF